MIHNKILCGDLGVFVNFEWSINESIFLGEIQFHLLYQNIDKDKISNSFFFITVDESPIIVFGFLLGLDPVTQKLMLQTAKPTFGHLTDVSKIFKLQEISLLSTL